MTNDAFKPHRASSGGRRNAPVEALGEDPYPAMLLWTSEAPHDQADPDRSSMRRQIRQ
jgi:hypothetical protein